MNLIALFMALIALWIVGVIVWGLASWVIVPVLRRRSW